MKQLIIKNYVSISTILITTIICGTLLMLRVKFTHSFLFLFLVWNLFLAAIPFVISFYLKERTNPKNLEILAALVPWLFFLPNAPYILTDFIHLSLEEGIIIWIDIVLFFSFSMTGLLLYFFSLQHMHGILLKKYNPLIPRILVAIIPFLCGFGIYLGRFERWNTWDLINNPFKIITNSYNLLFTNTNALFVWSFSIGFGILLYVGYTIFQKMTKNVL